MNDGYRSITPKKLNSPIMGTAAVNACISNCRAVGLVTVSTEITGSAAEEVEDDEVALKEALFDLTCC